jgi:ribosomal protein S18 acetylase RimI-like enzyme
MTIVIRDTTVEDKGDAEISLTVDPDNTKAQALYKRLGIDEFVVG